MEESIEKRYTKLTQLEHVLTRPDSYIGSVNQESLSSWVWDDTVRGIVNKTITYVPGMFKIFDEIIVNAADVYAREKFDKVKTTKSRINRITKISVTINTEKNYIEVYNNGAAIPVEIHQDYSIYVPELIFGQLLTSDNYNDSQDRYTGGRNGYGAKLANIFSTMFEVTIVDSKRKSKFYCKWRNNMTKKDDSIITPCLEPTDSVTVKFHPDFKKLNMPEKFNGDILSLLKKRVYDLAGTLDLDVYLNGSKININSFNEYVELYFQKYSGSKNKSIYERINPYWEVEITLSEGQFQQVSFVNNISTSKGGTHVNFILEPLIQSLLNKINSKNKKGLKLKSHHIKNHIFLFLNCRIVNPTFDSQTKEYMTLNMSYLSGSVFLSEKYILSVLKSSILETIKLWAITKEQVELKKLMKTGNRTSRKDTILGIPKLDDANDAGSKLSAECTLILTEGDSAKTSCIAGLSVVGRDKYGVFPLRGKLLNVRDASFKQLAENKEIQNILKIMGLEIGSSITNPSSLRYGSIMIMTDQDHDGSHIKGLIINLLQHFWPNLLKYNGFLKEFVTPIIKVTTRNNTISFFTLQQFEDWRVSLTPEVLARYKFKYYKGLGTSTTKEFQDYFSKIQDHQLEFVYEDPEDFESIDMAFNSKRAEDRRKWIQSFEEGTFLNHEIKRIRYKDFINKELVLFSRYDLERSIPNVIDGLKPAQRKVLFGAFKKNLTRNEMKVAQFASYVAEVSSYHHGEDSIAQTIVNMAQQFVGSNNLNLLEPCGQFGSRKEGGKDSSATRYIYTKLTEVCTYLFRSEDFPILEYCVDEGVSIEPKFYVPVIPNILVNGSEGIGTGWSSTIPNFNPKDIIANINAFLDEKPLKEMVPWYRGFIGRMERNDKSGFDSVGLIAETDENVFHISELPVKVWTQPYKEFIEDMLTANVTQAKAFDSYILCLNNKKFIIISPNNRNGL
uniref:DNA topoisomerase 2 n=1 Tax=Dermatophagoides pteronyssinus TaxID=6956 RepID=A0A6P6XLS5_DERPT|nr:DNA topoisomerase 2-like [Dermatophagoides pteronyssinus]